MSKLLEGQIAVVTGGGQNPKGPPGFGTATSKLLALNGATVVIVDRDLTFAQFTADEINAAGGKAFAYQLDMGIVADVIRVIGEIMKLHGTIDILVNNAGICRETPFLEVGETEFDLLMGVNAKGPFFAAQTALKLMVAAHPDRELKVVNIGSDAARKGARVASAAYSMAKAAVTNLVLCLGRVGQNHRVRCVGICPGPGATAMTASWPDDKVRALLAQFKMVGPEFVSAVQIALTVLFAVHPDMRHLNTTIIDVNGGTFPA